jgi:hypothetical protein
MSFTLATWYINVVQHRVFKNLSHLQEQTFWQTVYKTLLEAFKIATDLFVIKLSSLLINIPVTF